MLRIMLRIMLRFQKSNFCLIPIGLGLIFSFILFNGCGEDDKAITPTETTQPLPPTQPTQPTQSVQPTQPIQPIIPAEQQKKPETSFANNILPIFNANCNFAGCHGANPPSGLLLISYNNFKKGGVSGPPFIPGNSRGSLIIKRLRPGGGMPQGRPPLKKEEIQKISDWIDKGGKDN